MNWRIKSLVKQREKALSIFTKARNELVNLNLAIEAAVERSKAWQTKLAADIGEARAEQVELEKLMSQNTATVEKIDAVAS